MEIFNSLYKQYHQEVRARIDFKLSRIPSMKDLKCTSDILNDSFYKLYKHLAEFDSSKAQFNTWFFTIVDNTIIDYIRRFSKHNNNIVRIDNINSNDGNSKTVYEIPGDNVHADQLIDNSNINTEVIKAISKIKNKNQRKIAELFFINDLTYGEISQTLSLPLGTVKPSVMRIKGFLQQELKSVKDNIYA